MRCLTPLLLLLPLQDPGLSGQLAKAEALGFSHPDLANALEPLQARIASASQDLRDRFQTLQARAAILGHLHESLSKSVGTAVEVPWPAGKTTKARLLRLDRRALTIGLAGGGELEIGYDGLDPEGMAKSYLAGGGTPLFGALWLAHAGRWEAALKALGDRASEHPLIVDARRRAAGALLAKAPPLLEKDKWDEVLAILSEAAALAPAEVAEMRKQLRARVIAVGRTASTSGRRQDALRAAALIDKAFPDDKAVAEEIREAVQWTLLDDPKAFKRSGKKGEAIALDSGSKDAESADLESLPHDCTGFSARVRFEKDSKAHGGLMWEGRGRILWIDMENSYGVLSHASSGKKFVNDFDIDAPRAEAYQLTVLLEDGHYVAKVDGKEVGRVQTLATKLEGLALNAAFGKAWFDRIRIRRK